MAPFDGLPVLLEKVPTDRHINLLAKPLKRLD